MSKSITFLGVQATRQKPAKGYRMAIWENMLGTVYAMNTKGEVKYFAYEIIEARRWAGIELGVGGKCLHGMVARLFKNTARYSKPECPRVGQLVLYVK